jgi:hypothetical protein
MSGPQLSQIEERLRSVIWLDKQPVSFENMVYLVPRADLDPARRLAKYVAVVQGIIWENVGDLWSQNLNADVWISPVKRDELRNVADVLLRTAGKSPERKVPLGPLVRPILRQVVSGASAEDSNQQVPEQ